MVIALVLVILTVPAPSPDAPSDKNDPSFDIPNYLSLAPVRNTGQATSLIISPASSEQISGSDNISSEDGMAFTFERNSLEYFATLPATYQTTQDRNDGRIIVRYGPFTFVSHLIISGSWISFWLSRYDSRIDRWDPSVEVHNVSGYITASCEIAVAGDQLFYGMDLISAVGTSSGIYIKQVEVDDWAFMTNAAAVRLDTNGFVLSGGKLLAYEDDLLVFWLNGNLHECYMAAYRDLEWYAPVKVLSPAHDLIPGIREIEGRKELYIAYRKGLNDGLNVTVSTNGGLTWSSTYPQDIICPGNEVQYSSAEFEGKVYLLIVNRNNGTGRVYRCTDGWDLEYTHCQFISGPVDQMDGRFQGQITADRSQVIVTLEHGDGNIMVHGSKDGGTTFYVMNTYGGPGWCPVLDEDKGYLAYSQGSNLMIYRFVTESRGRITSSPFSPMGLSSWMDFGFRVEGFGPGSELQMRILGEDGVTKLFPASDHLDVLSLASGSIDGTGYNHFGRFSGEWTSGDDLAECVVLDITASRSSGEFPAILSIVLNHTNSFPIDETLTTSRHIASMMNMTYTSKGITLMDSKPIGQLVIGPLEMEDGWCDMVGIGTYANSHKVSYRVEIMDDLMRPVSGFTLKDSVPVYKTNEMHFMRWGESFLGDLPGTIHTIYLLIEVTADDPTARPGVGTVLFDNSEDPVIIGWSMEDGSVLRGGTAHLHIWVDDREEPDDRLSIQVAVMDPITGIWDLDMDRGQIWSDDHWVAPLETAYSDNIGTFKVSVMVKDSIGDSQTQTLGPILELRNNPPTQPGIYFIPEVPTTGDELGVEIYREATDLETVDENLSYNYRIFRDGTLHMELLGTDSLSASIEAGLVREGEEWRAEVTSWDGSNESLASVSSVTILNSAPILVGHPDNITLYEDQVSDLYDHRSWFLDKDGEELDIVLTIDDDLEVIVEDHGFRIRPGNDFNGRALLSVIVSDEESSIRANVPVIVLPVNDPPSLQMVEGRSVLQGEWINVTIVAYDILDGDDLTVWNDIPLMIQGINPGLNYMVLPNGSFHLLATNDMVGNHTITITATDGSAAVNTTLVIEVLNKNDPPHKPVIQMDPGRFSIVNGERSTLKADAFDPDLLWGDTLSYRWSSNISGVLGDGAEIEVELPPGNHLLTAEVTDSAGLKNYSSVIVEVSERGLVKKEVMDTPMLMLMIGGISLLSGILIALFILALARRKKEEEGPKENPAEGKDLGEDHQEEAGGGSMGDELEREEIKSSSEDTSGNGPTDGSPQAGGEQNG